MSKVAKKAIKAYRNSVIAQFLLFAAIAFYALTMVFVVPSFRLAVIQNDAVVVGAVTVGDFIQIFALITGSASLAGFLFLTIRGMKTT